MYNLRENSLNCVAKLALRQTTFFLFFSLHYGKVQWVTVLLDTWRGLERPLDSNSCAHVPGGERVSWQQEGACFPFLSPTFIKSVGGGRRQELVEDIALAAVACLVVENEIRDLGFFLLYRNVVARARALRNWVKGKGGKIASFFYAFVLNTFFQKNDFLFSLLFFPRRMLRRCSYFFYRSWFFFRIPISIASTPSGFSPKNILASIH